MVFYVLLQANFDQEVEVYRQYLETVYQVCAVCEYQVNRAIDEKHQMLMADLPTYGQSISRSSLDLNDTEEQNIVSIWFYFIILSTITRELC
jgi:hypothetical protein